MSGTADGGDEGTGEGEGNESKAKEERERKAEIRRRLIETMGEGRDGAGRQNQSNYLLYHVSVPVPLCSTHGRRQKV